MRRINRNLFLITVAVLWALVASCIPYYIAAQSFLQSWSDGSQVTYEWYHPSFSGSDYSALTNINFTSLSVPLGWKVWFRADIPFSYYRTRNNNPVAQVAIGNPYIGIANWLPGLPFLLDLGIRFPISSGGSSFIDKNSDYYRPTASGIKTWVFRANLHYIKHLATGLSLQFLLGSFLTIADEGYSGTSLYLNYGAHVRYRQGNFLLGGGFKGICALNVLFFASRSGIFDDGGFGNRGSSGQFYIEAGSPQERWTPSLYLAFPSDNNVSGTDRLNFVLGLRINVHLHK